MRKGAYHPVLQGNHSSLLYKSIKMSTIALSKVQTSASVFHFKDSLKTQVSVFVVNYTRHIYSIPYLGVNGHVTPPDFTLFKKETRCKVTIIFSKSLASISASISAHPVR